MAEADTPPIPVVPTKSFQEYQKILEDTCLIHLYCAYPNSPCYLLFQLWTENPDSAHKVVTPEKREIILREALSAARRDGYRCISLLIYDTSWTDSVARYGALKRPQRSSPCHKTASCPTTCVWQTRSGQTSSVRVRQLKPPQLAPED